MHHLSPAQMTDWIATWGYIGVFAMVFAGNFGVPVPEDTVLLMAGFLAGQDALDLSTLYAVGIASAVAGDCCGFVFGRTGGQRLIERLASRFRFIHERYERLKNFFEAHGAKTVFMARFIAGARFLAGPMAGAAGMPFLRFLAWNILGAVIWCSLVITVGYLLGDELDWIIQEYRRAGHWIALAAIIVVATLALIYWRRRRARRA